MLIKIITKDFKGARYGSPIDCPLYRALARLFPNRYFRVGGVTIGEYSNLSGKQKLNELHIPFEWLPNTVDNLINKADMGEQVEYELQLDIKESQNL